MIPDLNLRLALVSALAKADIIARLDLEALAEQYPPDLDDEDEDGGDYVYNGNLALALASRPLPEDSLAQLRELTWTNEKTMFAIWPLFDGETEEFFIHDLSGLEACTSLERLGVYEGGAGKITSLAPLAKLHKLVSIDLYGPVADLAPLGGLANLEHLSLRGIQITDLAPLLALAGLKKLRLEWPYHGAVDRAAAQAVVEALAQRAVDLEVVLPGFIRLLPPRPPGNELRCPPLEAQIRSAPDDENAYLVYADWLQERGDPLGELIVLDHRLANHPAPELVEARRAHFVRHKERFLRHVKDSAGFVWRLGHIRAARHMTYPDHIAALLATPAASFLTELQLFALHGQKVVDAVVQAEPAPPLLELELEQRSESLDASPIWRRFPGLRVVKLASAGGLTVGDMDLPLLRELSFAGGPSLALASVLGGRGLANLRVLALGCQDADALLAALAKAPLLDWLEELDLRKSGPVGSAGVAAIGAALDRFQRIPRRAFRIGAVTEPERELLHGLCTHTPDDEG